MKKLLSLVLCFIIAFSIPFVANAEQTDKIDDSVMEYYDKFIYPDSYIQVYVEFEPFGSLEDMPSWPNVNASKIELDNYKKCGYADFVEDVFNGLEYELVHLYYRMDMCLVSVNIDDIEKIADNENVAYITMGIDFPANELFLKSLYKNQFSVSDVEEYSELYYKFDDEGKLQWALIKAENDDHFSLDYTEVVISDMLVSSYVSEPFYLTYGVYNPEYDKFFDLYDIKDDIHSYEGLEETLKNTDGIRQIGDVNNDSQVNIVDATLIQRTIAKLERISYNKIISDFDKDGKVNICDVTSIQRFVAKYM